MGAQIWKGWAVGGILLAGLTLGAFSPAESEDTSGKIDLHLAVVSYERLMEAHPDYNALLQLDERLRLLSEEKAMIKVRAQRAIMASAGEEMQKAVLEGQQEMEAEKRRIEGELSAISSRLAGQMKTEMDILQQGYQEDLKRKIEELGGGAPPEAPVADHAQGQVKEYLENLSLVRERNLASRRLELEKQVQAEILAEQQRLDAQVASYEDELAGQYQAEKLNLQLKVQNAATDEERGEAETRLGAIADEIASAKSARRAEIGAGMSSFRAEKSAWLEKELVSYQRSLDTEVQQKLANKRAELGGGAPPPPPKASQEITQKIRQIESSLQAELEAKKAKLRARMQAETEVAQETLLKKQKEVEERLRKLEAEITERIAAESDNLPEDVKSAMEASDKEIKEAEDQRQALYDKMVEELNVTVGKVAEEKKAPMVIGSFVVNRSCDDLTDFAMVAVKQMER